MSSWFSSLATTLSNAGVSSANLSSTISAITSLKLTSVSSTVMPELQQLGTLFGQPAGMTALIGKIQSTAGLPASVGLTLNELPSATTLDQYLAIIQRAEQFLTAG